MVTASLKKNRHFTFGNCDFESSLLNALILIHSFVPSIQKHVLGVYFVIPVAIKCDGIIIMHTSLLHLHIDKDVISIKGRAKV